MKRIILSLVSLSTWLFSTNAFAFNGNNHTIPEPSTFLLVGAGLVGAGFLRKRFKK